MSLLGRSGRRMGTLTRCPACHGDLEPDQRLACSQACLAALEESVTAWDAYALDLGDELARARHDRALDAIRSLRHPAGPTQEEL